MENQPYDDQYDEPFGAGEPFAGDLSQYEDPFASSDVDNSDYDPVPDGKYQVNVEKAELTRTKTTNKVMLKWTLRILAPQFRGRLLWKNSVFSDDSIKWIKKDLYVCDLKLQRISDLPANIHKLLDVKLEIAKVTNGEYENIFFNKRIVTADDGANGSNARVPQSARAQF